MSSDSRVTVVRLGAITKHDNADSLGVVQVFGGYPCIVRLGEFNEGDLAIYVPMDMVVPDRPEFAFLEGNRRIKARRLRGTFSMGLLVKAPLGAVEGDDVTDSLGFVKWEPLLTKVQCSGQAPDEVDGSGMPVYTDIESLRRWGHMLELGERVIITEKIHGENARFCWRDGRMWVGSRTRVKQDNERSQWWRAARQYGLAAKLATALDLVFFGETHGYTGGYPYGVERGGLALRIFDVWERGTRRYLDFDDAAQMLRHLGLPTVPVLFDGPWSPDLRSLAEGQSTLDPSHVREGIVVRPVRERRDHELGRVVLKLHGEGFLVGKGKSHNKLPETIRTKSAKVT